MKTTRVTIELHPDTPLDDEGRRRPTEMDVPITIEVEGTVPVMDGVHGWQIQEKPRVRTNDRGLRNAGDFFGPFAGQKVLVTLQSHPTSGGGYAAVDTYGGVLTFDAAMGWRLDPQHAPPTFAIDLFQPRIGEKIRITVELLDKPTPKTTPGGVTITVAGDPPDSEFEDDQAAYEADRAAAAAAAPTHDEDVPAVTVE